MKLVYNNNSFKKNLMKMKKMKIRLLPYLIIVGMVLCGFMASAVNVLLALGTVFPEGGGAVGVDEATSVSRTHDDSPDLILHHVEEKVTKIRPHEVKLYTIASQVKKVVHSSSQIVDYYSIDVLEMTTVTIAASTLAAQVELKVADPGIIMQEQTLLVSGVPGYLEDGTTVDPDNNLVLYVVGRSTADYPLVVAMNGVIDSGVMKVPAIGSSKTIIRMGIAGSESQIQCDPYSGVVTKKTQYLQKFMTQIEQTTMFKIAKKEVDWDFSDEDELALFEMKRSMNMTYLLGVKRMRKLRNAHREKAEEVYVTGGVWNQAGKEFSFGGVDIDESSMVAMMKVIFTGSASGQRKVLIIGSDLLERFEKVDYKKLVYAGATEQAYGIEFNSIVSKFGHLYVVHDQTFNDAEMSDCGMVLDPELMTKYTVFDGIRTTNWNNRELAISDSDARGIMEISGLVLRDSDAHARITFA
jgi:hypothetical protein